MGELTSWPGIGSLRRLDTGLLLRAYRAGLFPMADTRDAEDVFWVEPRRRGILPIEGFHLSRSLARALKAERFRHSCDLAFEAVLRHCAATRPGREESWINPTIFDAYLRLHAEGHAHSIETWTADGRLVGGLYGVRIGGAFFGESMFSLVADASKAALAHLVARLSVGGFRLLDTQFLTAHLARLGGIEIPRKQYLHLLSGAVAAGADWGALDAGSAAGLDRLAPLSLPFGCAPEVTLAPERLAGAGPSGKRIVQLLSHTS
jgi:leucyl/phenylalanyl-tRNA--protein transferase